MSKKGIKLNYGEKKRKRFEKLERENKKEKIRGEKKLERREIKRKRGEKGENEIKNKIKKKE